ncbi:MAG: hypothetical protein AAF368_18285, partial [Planctomycetota bacterium]
MSDRLVHRSESSSNRRSSESLSLLLGALSTTQNGRSSLARLGARSVGTLDAPLRLLCHVSSLVPLMGRRLRTARIYAPLLAQLDSGGANELSPAGVNAGLACARA